MTNGHSSQIKTSSTPMQSDEPPKSVGDPTFHGEIEHMSPQPSNNSELSEADKEYQQYMGKMIPEFVPKKQAQFRPILSDPFSDSEVEAEGSGSIKSPTNKKSAQDIEGPGRFIPVLPGAVIQPQTHPGGKCYNCATKIIT